MHACIIRLTPAHASPCGWNRRGRGRRRRGGRRRRRSSRSSMLRRTRCTSSGAGWPHP